MNPDRPSRTPMPAVAPRTSRSRVGRMAALAAGATLGLGALTVPLATANSDGAPTGSPLALVADTTAPTVVLGATAVKPGGEVPFTASGFPAGATLSVKFDDKTLLKQFPVGEDGSVTGAVTVPADAAVGGEHWLRFLAPQTSVRSENLTVTGDAPSPTPTPTPTPTSKPTPKPTATATSPVPQPGVRLGSSEVTAGGKVSFTLSGFAKGQNVTVKLDDSEIIGQWTAAVNAAGTFSGTVTLPKSTTGGAHWLRFLAPNPSTSLRAGLTVKAADTAGTGGSGTGGGSGGGGTAETAGTSGGSGTAGGSGSSAGASASITAGSRVAAGGRVTFRVSGFPAGEQLTVKLDDSEIIGQWPDGIGADGTLSATVTIPSSATKGAHWLRFLAPNPSTSIRADFTVTAGTSADVSATGASGSTAAPVPAASGTPATASNSRGARAQIAADQVQAGGKLHFTVTKFPAGRTVTIKLDDDAILGQWKTDAKGSYEGDVTVPAEVPSGAHWLRFLAPDPATTLKVDFEVTGADGAPGSAPTAAVAAPDAAPLTTTAASMESSVSYATIAWSAAAAAAGGAAGAAGTTLFVVRRRRPSSDQR
ncbi:hypothetical protein [Streptomyces sp. NBC_00385]|uniref:hypothetical protein n=1 Tax=Streptomyces sp. NBC_00385 TaxID=2975733 RepID=UPI002DDB96EA|nr:hypothetical protein [Streptomyces sp. NBC_00385]WRZ08270.1 hypothetical protein OG959_35445 [Streptomyces sp. NBC_00385]